MLKVTLTNPDGSKALLIGLSFANLDALRAGAGATFIKIQAAQLGLSHDVLVFAGETETHLATIVAHDPGAQFTPDSVVSVSKKVAN
jgi:hypothetical protein